MAFYKPTVLCIPQVDISVKSEDVFKNLVAMNIGYVYKIFEKPVLENKNKKSFFIKFSWNTKNNNALFLKNKLNEKGSLKIVYQDPWYWKMTENKKLIYSL
tara:strand:+ start:1205 stop:1507 length:303 start_codon:yes stop_codon:yes gene_type:complete